MKRAVAALQPLWQTVLAAGFFTIILDLAGVLNPPGGIVWVLGVVAALVVAGLLLNTGPDADSSHTVEVAAPVHGRWLAVNSPGQQIPTHGTKALGQLSAADLVQPDEDPAGHRSPPLMRRGLRGSRPQLYRCFGAPICSMAAGVVVAVSTRQPDQRARNTWQAMAWFVTAENVLRALAGWRAVIGNRVVIRHDDGLYAAYVHLKRGSAEVSVGERVQQGQVIAAVGNTGNSTQPHLHVQLMDRPRFPAAAGLPMVWENIELGQIDPAWAKYAEPADSSALEDMPRNGQVFDVSERAKSEYPDSGNVSLRRPPGRS